MNKIKILMVSVFSIALMSAPMFVMATTYAATESATQSGLCGGANLQPPNEDGECENINSEASSSVDEVVKLVINLFSWVVGVVAVIMIIYGGFQYITAAGDSGKVSNAKNTILYALIGLVIVALAQVIVRFVLGNITSLQN